MVKLQNDKNFETFLRDHAPRTPAAPPGELEKIRRAIDRSRPRRRWAPAAFMAAAAALLLCILSAPLWRPSSITPVEIAAGELEDFIIDTSDAVLYGYQEADEVEL